MQQNIVNLSDRLTEQQIGFIAAETVQQEAEKLSKSTMLRETFLSSSGFKEFVKTVTCKTRKSLQK